MARQKVDIARSFAQAGNRIFLGFAVFLLLLWTQGVLPVLPALKEVREQRLLLTDATDASLPRWTQRRLREEARQDSPIVIAEKAHIRYDAALKNARAKTIKLP